MDDFLVEKAKIEDLEELWVIMSEINNKNKQLMIYEDYSVSNSKEALEEILLDSHANEIVLVARADKRVIGTIHILFCPDDYLFFVDKYVYIKYFYLAEEILNNSSCKKEVSEKLFKSTIELAHKYGFKYMCGDILMGDNELKDLFEMNHMEPYRHRLCKKIV